MKTHIAVLLLVILASCTQATESKDEGVSTQEVVYYEGKSFTGYLAKPSGKGSYPALILIHEWWGLNEYIKQRALDFANQGYLVLAVDLYEGESTTKPEEAKKLASTVSSNMDEAFANLEHAISYVKKMKSVDKDRVGSVGWCFGGGWSYQIAKNNLGAKASVIYYGRFNPEDDLEIMRSTILGNFGEKDVLIKVDDVKTFQATLKKHSKEHEIYIYENAGHAFDNKGGANYNEAASNLAWDRTLAFLKKHL